MAANAPRVPKSDVLLSESSANGCSPGCALQQYQALVSGLESGLAVVCRPDLSHSLELSDQSNFGRRPANMGRSWSGLPT